jgi:ribosomal protein S18 acetylase RimI-like enzyme
METMATTGLQTTTTRTFLASCGKARRVNNPYRCSHHRRCDHQYQYQQHKVSFSVVTKSTTNSSSSSSRAEEEGEDEQDAFAETRRESANETVTTTTTTSEQDDDSNTDNKSKKRWECSQCFGNQSVLVSQLRDVSEVLADGFGKPADDLLNGLMQKTRWSAGNFACVIARPYGSQPYKPSKRLTAKSVRRKGATQGASSSAANKDKQMFRDGNDIVGACDLTLLPAFGPKASRESRVKNGVKLLRLSNESNFLYLTGMTTRSANRRMGVGKALLEECDVIAQKMEKSRPKCIALHVAKNNASAIGLYESCGYRIVSEATTTKVDGSGGDGDKNSGSSNEEKSPSSFGDKFMQFANKMGSVPKIGGDGGEEEVHFMVKWIRPDVIDEKVKLLDETGALKEIPTL